MAKMVDVTCYNKKCKEDNGKRKIFQARAVDVKRGWGKFCCKSCKAVEQEGRTHQYANYCDRRVNAIFNGNKRVLEDDEFFANFSNEDDGDFDWAYEESDFCTS